MNLSQKIIFTVLIFLFIVGLYWIMHVIYNIYDPDEPKWYRFNPGCTAELKEALNYTFFPEWTKKKQKAEFDALKHFLESNTFQ